MRILLLISFVGLASCSRTNESTRPTAVAEGSHDASVGRREGGVADAGARTISTRPASPFTIIARGPTSPTMRYDHPLDELAHPMPLVRRLPGGGLVFASQYGRAIADGAGPLSVELFGRGLESEVYFAPVVSVGYEGLRWVHTDGKISIVTAEVETGRNGPRLRSYTLGAEGWKTSRRDVGYWSAVVRDGSVLALERTAYEIPNSSIYPKGSEYEANNWGLRPARLALLSGKGPAPVLPPGLCPTAMGAAPDGTVVVTVDKCSSDIERPKTGGVLRFPPGATQAKVEWFPERTMNDPDSEEAVVFVASASEIYVAEGDRLETWDGKAWSASQPFPRSAIGSLSRSPSGELWMVVRDNRIMKRGVDKTTFTQVHLPLAPADRLDPEVYAFPDMLVDDFRKLDELPENQAIRDPGEVDLVAYSVDATIDDDVIVLAVAKHEAFVLGTRPRSPVARIPSISVQRARLGQTMKREVATADKRCTSKSLLVFPDGVDVSALRTAFGDAGTTADGKIAARIGEGTVEGQKRPFVYGEHEGVVAAARRLASLSPKRLCGPAVVDRDL